MLLYVDPMGDDWATADAIARGWTLDHATVASGGRNAGQCLQLGGYWYANQATAFHNLPANAATLICGFAISHQNMDSVTPTRFLAALDNGTEQWHLEADSAGHILAYSGGTLLGQSAPGVFLYGTWQFVEIKVLHHGASSGTLQVRMNGDATPVLDLSSVRTAQSANNYANRIEFLSLSHGPDRPITYVDDLYVCDGTTANNNDFLGDCRVVALIPEADGHVKQWAPNAGSDQFSRVDETTADNDTTYTSDGTVGEEFLVTFPTLPAGTTAVKGVQLVLNARKDDAGSRTIAPVLSDGVTDSVGSDLSLGDSYQDDFFQYDTDPVAVGAWSVSAVNALQAGAKVTG